MVEARIDSKQKIDKRFIRKWCKERKCRLNLYGDKPSILLLGESHGTPRHLELEEEIVSLVKPSILLHEFLKNTIYDPITGSFSLVHETANDESDIRDMRDVESYLLGWSNKYKTKLVGADLSLFELSRAGDEIERKKPNLILTAQTPEECEYREKRMGERIADYRKKVDGMLVGMFGMHHLRPSSGIHPILQLEGIEYACIIMPKNKKN